MSSWRSFASLAGPLAVLACIALALAPAACGTDSVSIIDGDGGSGPQADAGSRPDSGGQACSKDNDCAVGNLCVSGACAPGCHSARDCPASQKICDPSGGPNGECVECLTPADCPAGDTCFAGNCDKSCNVETDCPGQHCDTTKHVCVACVSSDQCTIGNLCANDVCVPGCTSDRDCPASAPHCDGAVQPRGACVQCLSPSDCSPGVSCVAGTCGGSPPADGGCDTKVHGTVYDPAKHKPIYDAIVYVPGAALTPIAPGVSCDRCGARPDGSPVTATLSKPDGTFVLDNVPAGTDVPIVVQVGKWRRENARIAVVPACADTAVDPELTRLPKMQSEGHLPQIAIATGLDTMECALQTMGIDASEFTASSGTGRVHIYQGSTAYGATAPTGTTTPASTLWASPSLLSGYDIVIDACQGAAPTDKPQPALDNLAAYAAQGGRLYLSHYENFVIWPTTGTSAWSGTATEDATMAGTGTATGITADRAFPKGDAFAQWAVAASDATALGSVSSVTNARADVSAVASTSKAWMSGLVTGAAASHVLQYTFYSGASACGKVAYSDFHVSAGTQALAAFPAECSTASPDSVATDLFEFFFLDALSCAQDDSQPPQVPPL